TEPGQGFKTGKKHAEHERDHQHHCEDPPQPVPRIQVTWPASPDWERKLKPPGPKRRCRLEDGLFFPHRFDLGCAILPPAFSRWPEHGRIADDRNTQRLVYQWLAALGFMLGEHPRRRAAVGDA